MSRRTSFVLPSMITALAASTCVFTLPASTAFAAACNAAPKSPAPQGSHWYYRTDRSLGRKCWYLAAEGSKGQVAVPKPSAANDDEETNAKPAARPMAAAAARLTEPLRSPPPPVPPAADWTIAQAAPSAPMVAPPREPAQRSDEPAAEAPAANAAQAPIMNTVQEPNVADQQPAAAIAPAPGVVAAPAPSAAAPPASERTNMLQFVFVAFAGFCFLAGIFFYFAARRRSMEVRILDLNTPPSLRMPLVESTADAPSLDAPSLDAPSLDAPSLDAPSLAPDAGGRRDNVDVDERLRRFSQAWKRQAA